MKSSFEKRSNGQDADHRRALRASLASRHPNLGFDVYLASDAIAAFELTGPDGKRYSAEEIHSVSLATLHQEFATIVDSQAVLDSVRQA